MSTQIGPGLRDYLSSLENKLRRRGLSGPLLVMQSNGGAVAAAEAPAHAISTVGFRAHRRGYRVGLAAPATRTQEHSSSSSRTRQPAAPGSTPPPMTATPSGPRCPVNQRKTPAIGLAQDFI